jgi:hypothetical protein
VGIPLAEECASACERKKILREFCPLLNRYTSPDHIQSSQTTVFQGNSNDFAVGSGSLYSAGALQPVGAVLWFDEQFS